MRFISYFVAFAVWVVMGVDADGCNQDLQERLEEECDIEYEKANENAELAEELEKVESLCCAVEDFERCNLQAYFKANCAADNAAVKENLKAARLFISVISGISCTEFRGRCKSYSSAVAKYDVHSGVLIMSVMVSRFLYLYKL